MHCEPSLLAVWEHAAPPLFPSQTQDKFDGSAGHPISPQGKVSTLGSKVRIRFKVSVIENACLVGRAVDLMTNDRFLEGYSLIREMQANDFLIALRRERKQGMECHGQVQQLRPEIPLRRGAGPEVGVQVEFRAAGRPRGRGIRRLDQSLRR